MFILLMFFFLEEGFLNGGEPMYVCMHLKARRSDRVCVFVLCRSPGAGVFCHMTCLRHTYLCTVTSELQSSRKRQFFSIEIF